MRRIVCCPHEVMCANPGLSFNLSDLCAVHSVLRGLGGSGSVWLQARCAQPDSDHDQHVLEARFHR